MEAHAQAVARVLHAFSEYLGGSVDLIKENLPQLDGGESLVQQVDLVAAAASGASECADAFTDVHEDRLKRQREPEPGEQNWDTPGAMLNAVARPAWLAWVALAVFGGVVHRWIWGRVAEVSDPHHPRGAEYRRRRNGGVWENAFAAAGLGNVHIESVTERWSGMDVVFRTDPHKATSFNQIKAVADKLVDLAHKAFREDGQEEGLGLGEAEVKSLQQRDLFMLRIRTRDPLQETIVAQIPSRDEFTIRDNDTSLYLMWIRSWDGS